MWRLPYLHGGNGRRAALPCVQLKRLMATPSLQDRYSPLYIGTFKVIAVMSKWITGTGMSQKLIHITRNTDGYFRSGLGPPQVRKYLTLHSALSFIPDRVATTLGHKGT
jgi:hypothetical protein